MSAETTHHPTPDETLQKEKRRTLIFVGTAVACLAITAVWELATKPPEITEFGKLGQEFYPEFTDPTAATSLSVKVIDADELKPLEFSVKQEESGRWVIPSHHNYPADAEDQLAKTASSVIGIKRGAMVTRWATDHARYGVVDPETDSVGVDELEGIGKRLTLEGPDGKVLASYIIGKKVEDSEEENAYYVRHPDEDEVYIANLDISLSTKFSDWIDTDLLDIESFDVLRLVLKDYAFQERGASLAVTKTEISTLTRESSNDDWKLEGLDDPNLEVDQDAVRETVDTLADLKIVGVRPKQPGLTPDLQLDRSVIKTQRDVDRLQADLLARGFLLQPSQDDPNVLELIAREGEMFVGVESGLNYQLHFGRVFTGSEKELEIGLTDDSDDQADAESSDGDDQDEADAGDSDEAADQDQDDEAEESSEESSKPGRYVFVRVQVDKSLLGEEPHPVEPAMPEELKQAEEELKNKQESEQATDEGSDQEAVDPNDDQPAADQSGSDQSDKAAAEPEDTASGDTASENTDSDGDADAPDTPDAGDSAPADDNSQEVTSDESKPDQNAEATSGDNGDAESSDTKEETLEEKVARLRAEYEAAQQKYKDDLRALDEYKDKLEAAEKKAEELNRRYAKWYYVIPGESYDKLALSREDLIKEKDAEGEAGEPEAGMGAMPPGGPQLDLQSIIGGAGATAAAPTADPAAPTASSEPTLTESPTGDNDETPAEASSTDEAASENESATPSEEGSSESGESADSDSSDTSTEDAPNSER